MKRMLFALMAATAVASSTGCCCLEQWLCHPWGCSSCGGGGGCGDSCCDSCGGGGGYGGGYGGGGGCCSSCGMAGGHSMGGQQQYAGRPPRNSGGQMAYDEGPPTGGVTYPYYTNRGPRDFLARNPRSIGP